MAMTFAGASAACAASMSKDSLDEILSSWGTTQKDEGVEATVAWSSASFDKAEFKSTTIITTTTAAPSSHYHDEFGFPFFSSLPNATSLEEKEEDIEEDDFQQLINCAPSFSSVSTMTKATLTTANLPQKQSAEITPSSYKATPNKSRKRPSPAGLRGALYKLSLCGHSAKEDTLDSEYVVLTLRQALTAQEATTSLRHMVRILKEARVNSKDGNLSISELQEGLVAAGADHCVISTLWNFPSNVPVQYYGLVAMGELVAHSHLANQKSIVMKGGIEVVLTAMKTHASQEDVQEEACRTLKNLMKYFDTAKQHVARHKGIVRILQAMMTHPEYANVQRQACYALTSLSCLKSISDELVAKQGHAVLLKTMQHHSDDCFVLAEAWRTLTNIVIHSMNSTLDEEIAAHGLDLICQSMLHFVDCNLVPIQARGLTLLTHLCYRSPANLERLTLTENLEIVHLILRTWKYDEKVQSAGEKLVQQISQAGYSLPQTQGSRRASNRSSSKKGRHGVAPQAAVISQIQNDRGLDVIVDTTMM